jgi:membrane complex biogenesis BtpA family protein
MKTGAASAPIVSAGWVDGRSDRIAAALWYPCTAPMDTFAAPHSLIAVIHLPALPGAPRYGGSMSAVLDRVARDAETIARAGFDAVIVENFGDAPFFRDRVGSETVAAMALCGERARRASGLPLGINVLRNDGRAALAVAAATEARFIRVNVLVGARVTDQGVIEGDAAELLRARASLGLSHVKIVADVDVKHSSPLGSLSITDEAIEAVERALADVVIVSGSRTGEEASRDIVLSVRSVVDAPVWVGSGVRADTVADWLTAAHGVIVGSALRADGRAGGPIDLDRARAFVAARPR